MATLSQETAMSSSKQRRRSEPVWWSVQHTLVWRDHLPELRREFHRHTDTPRREEIASLGPDDAVFQRHPTTPRNVGIERAHAVPDKPAHVGTGVATTVLDLIKALASIHQAQSVCQWR
jgi:hypothetical protein